MVRMGANSWVEPKKVEYDNLVDRNQQNVFWGWTWDNLPVNSGHLRTHQEVVALEASQAAFAALQLGIGEKDEKTGP